MSKTYTIITTDRVSGHGETRPCYEIKYSGWELENLPTEVVSKQDYDKLKEETLNFLKDLANIENYRPGPKGVTYNLGKNQYATIKKIKDFIKKLEGDK